MKRKSEKQLNSLMDRVAKQRPGRFAEFLSVFEPSWWLEDRSEHQTEEEVFTLLDCAPTQEQLVMYDWLKNSI